MPRRRPPVDLSELLTDRDGVASRAELLARGCSPEQLRDRVTDGRWQRVHPGVYAVTSGPLTDRAIVRAGWIAAGPGAVLTGRTGLWLGGLEDPRIRPLPVEVAVPHRRSVIPRAGVRVLRVRGLDRMPRLGSPPRLTVESALLDLTRRLTEVPAVLGLVIAAVQQRLTTAERLSRSLDGSTRHPFRRLLQQVLTEITDGVRSPLELRYRARVERAHGLPAGEYDVRESSPGTGVRYRDVRYRPGETQPPRARRVLVELDGREAHPAAQAFRDRRRDNVTAAAGVTTLRYGWIEVAGDPCGVAEEVAAALRAHGWQVEPRPCGPGCTL